MTPTISAPRITCGHCGATHESVVHVQRCAGDVYGWYEDDPGHYCDFPTCDLLPGCALHRNPENARYIC